MSSSGPRSTAAFTRRRLLAAVPGLALLALAHPTAAQDDAGTPAAGGSTPEGAWTFTDDRGITVTLPRRPERIVAQVTGAAALWDYGIRPIAVFGPQRRSDGSQDPQSGGVDLDAVASIGEAWGEFDVEQLLALQPDLLVSQFYGAAYPLWYVPEEAEAILADVVPTAGIFVQDVPVTQPIARFAELAGLLGADLNAQEVIEAKDRFDHAVDNLKAAIAEKPDLSVLVVAGDTDHLYVANPTIATDLIFFRELGMDIVQPDVRPDEFWEWLSWEQATKHPADLILNDARTQSLTPDQLAAIPTWNEHPAVKAGQVANWHSEMVYSYKSYAPVLAELAAVVRASRADVV